MLELLIVETECKRERDQNYAEDYGYKGPRARCLSAKRAYDDRDKQIHNDGKVAEIIKCSMTSSPATNLQKA